MWRNVFCAVLLLVVVSGCSTLDQPVAVEESTKEASIQERTDTEIEAGDTYVDCVTGELHFGTGTQRRVRFTNRFGLTRSETITTDLAGSGSSFHAVCKNKYEYEVPGQPNPKLLHQTLDVTTVVNGNTHVYRALLEYVFNAEGVGDYTTEVLEDTCN